MLEPISLFFGLKGLLSVFLLLFTISIFLWITRTDDCFGLSGASVSVSRGGCLAPSAHSLLILLDTPSTVNSCTFSIAKSFTVKSVLSDAVFILLIVCSALPFMATRLLRTVEPRRPAIWGQIFLSLEHHHGGGVIRLRVPCRQKFSVHISMYCLHSYCFFLLVSVLGPVLRLFNLPGFHYGEAAAVSFPLATRCTLSTKPSLHVKVTVSGRTYSY